MLSLAVRVDGVDSVLQLGEGQGLETFILPWVFHPWLLVVQLRRMQYCLRLGVAFATRPARRLSGCCVHVAAVVTAVTNHNATRLLHPSAVVTDTFVHRVPCQHAASKVASSSEFVPPLLLPPTNRNPTATDA